jgi:transposase
MPIDIDVIHQETGLPIYFRYCPGNVIDVSTLGWIIEELKKMVVNTKFFVMDAGYYDNGNLGLLFSNRISFIMRKYVCG